MKSLRYEYILEYRDAFWEGHSFYVMMELASGGDLSKLIELTEESGLKGVEEVKVVRLMTQSLLAVRCFKFS